MAPPAAGHAPPVHPATSLSSDGRCIRRGQTAVKSLSKLRPVRRVERRRQDSLSLLKISSAVPGLCFLSVPSILPRADLHQTWKFQRAVWMSFVRAVALILGGFFRSQASLALETLALRQQLAVLRPNGPGCESWDRLRQVQLPATSSAWSCGRDGLVDRGVLHLSGPC